MQIVPFSTHYQLVYTNFDFSSFSLISCFLLCVYLLPIMRLLASYYAFTCFLLCVYLLPIMRLLASYYAFTCFILKAIRLRRRSISMTFTRDRKSTRLNSSHANISYAVFCLKKKKKHI